ncbi:MAG: hypothetical protein WBO73_01190 [Gammaproteobacteria bacterium]|jgi:hypothetical protein
MKKTIFITIAVLIVVIVGAVFYVFSNLDAIVKAAIEQHGSDAVKTSVQVEGVAIKLTEGAAAIKGLTIANPEGFSMPQAFSLGEIAVDINLEKTDKELIAIDAINIAAPQVFYEINAARQGSLNVLKDNLGGGAGTTTPQGDTSTVDEAAPIQLDIARLELQDASLHARIVPLDDKTYDLKLPALVLTNLRGTPDQISTQLLDKLIDHARQEIQKQGLEKELAEIKAKAQQRIDEERAKLEQETDARIEEEKQKAEDKLKNLLSR